MIRVLELESSRGWGGQERRTARLVGHLDPQRFEVHFGVHPESGLWQRRKELGATFHPLALRQSYDLPALWRLVRLVRREGIDILATHSGKDAWLGALAGRITGRPVVRTRHLQTPIGSPISYNLGTRVVCVSRQVADHLRERGVRPEKLEVIHTGIDTGRFRPERRGRLRALLEVGPETPLIGIVAVLRKAKRHEDLIDAFMALGGEAHLVIMGSGPQQANLERRIADSGGQARIHLLGRRDDVPLLLPDLDVFVLPSEMEALGTAILEASACGVPVVASRVGGIPECVMEGETGFLFEAHDVAALRAHLRRLLERPDLCRGMGRAGRTFIEREFSVERMVERTEALYEGLAG